MISTAGTFIMTHHATFPSIERSLSPVLNNDKGYFALGSESSATHVFLFNIFVCFGRHVQLAFPKGTKILLHNAMHQKFEICTVTFKLSLSLVSNFF